MKYDTEVYTADGHRVPATIEANSLAEFYEKLTEQGHILINKDEVLPSRRSARVPFASEKVDFYRELAIYIEHGVASKTRTNDLIQLANDGPWKEAMRAFLTRLEGTVIGKAMRLNPATFSEMEVVIFENITEDNVPKVLREFSDFFGTVTDVRSKIHRAAIIPAINVGMMLFIFGIYVFNVAPTMRNTGVVTATNIPSQFIFLATLHDYVLDLWHLPIVLGSVALVALLVWLVARTSYVRDKYDAFLMNFKPLQAYLLERRLFVLLTLHLVVEAGQEALAFAIARDVSVGCTFYNQLDIAHKVNNKDIPPPDNLPRTLWSDSTRFAKTVFTSRYRTLLKIGEERGLLAEHLRLITDQVRADLKVELEQLPLTFMLGSTAVVVIGMAFIIFGLIVPFGYYVSHFGQ